MPPSGDCPLDKTPIRQPPKIVPDTQWLFTEAELLRTPSVLDGMAPETERENRGKGVNFIIQVGIMIRLPQLTLATASVFLHRFFMRHTMVENKRRPHFHYYAVAATAVYLASKVEEHSRKMRELVIACCRVAQKNPNMCVDEQSKEYWRWRDTIIHNEDVLLEALCFDLSIVPPYKLLYDDLRFLREENNKPLRNSAWAFLNDSNLTMLCLIHTAPTIAAAAIYCGAKHCDVSFPDIDGKPWWEAIHVDLVKMRQACNYMAGVYERSPLRHSENVYSRTPEGGGPAFAKTRLVSSPDHSQTPAQQTPAQQTPTPTQPESMSRSSSGQTSMPPPTDRGRSSSKRPREEDSQSSKTEGGSESQRKNGLPAGLRSINSSNGQVTPSPPEKGKPISGERDSKRPRTEIPVFARKSPPDVRRTPLPSIGHALPSHPHANGAQVVSPGHSRAASRSGRSPIMNGGRRNSRDSSYRRYDRSQPRRSPPRPSDSSNRGYGAPYPHSRHEMREDGEIRDMRRR
ncbi:MAG: hypothetical protein M1829_001865 [Trizodia sp. TS-e1964]|nr:MAG: hypothetical protein M1829_001865 [Trizodia sp. TS-e1964]